ncbi:MAG TPA: pilus assembly protein TadG-related protein [Mycobacteriales bacterium]|nr:pilus assembly protein TadG-related protein [Mycobacteriales bacterium]
MPMRARGTDDGSVLVLVIGYVAIAAVLITVGVDVSKVFLARRALASAADSAVLAAAQGIDTAAIYRGGALRCGEPLPLDPQHAADLAQRSLSDDAADLRHVFASLGPPATTVDGGTVTVVLRGRVDVPFGRVVGWLDGSASGGRIGVSETSHARSPVAGGLC